MVKVDTHQKRILVVEDEPLIGSLCLRVLTADGFQVDIATDGLAAKNMLSKQEYDLCLIDIRTRAMNGMELYRHLEAKHTELISAVIFTTGDLLSEDAQQFLNEVNRPFLPKPFTPHELIAVVTETLEQADIKLPLEQTMVI